MKKDILRFYYFCILLILLGCQDNTFGTNLVDVPKSYKPADIIEIKKDSNDNTNLRNVPKLFKFEDIFEVKKDFKNTDVVYYYSPNGKKYIKEIMPFATKECDTEYIGENIIMYENKEIWRKSIYLPGEPKIVDSISANKVQWLNDHIALIHGKILFYINDYKTENFNELSEYMLNYGLNKTKDKIVCSYIKDQIYRLSLYDFKDKTWQHVFEKEINRTYFLGAKIMWRRNDEIIFVTGVENDDHSNESIISPEVLDIWKINTETGQSEMLIENAELCGNTGSAINDKFVYIKYSLDNKGNVIENIAIYDLEGNTTSWELLNYKANAAFWLIEKGLFGFYSKQEGKIKILDDQNGIVLGEIDVTSICDSSKHLQITAEGSMIEIEILNQEYSMKKYYQVDIKPIIEGEYGNISDKIVR